MGMFGGPPISEHIEIGDYKMITDESFIIISVFCKQPAEFP